MAATLSPLIASAVADIREALCILEVLARAGELDAKSALDGIRHITDSVDEIEQVAAPAPDLGGVRRLPVLTLADIVAEARRPALSVIEGGRP